MTQALLNAVLPISKSLRIIDPGELSQINILADVDLLVIPSARSIPPSFIPALNQYLKSGGRLIACGLPLGELGVVKSSDKWMSQTDFQAALEQIKPQTILLKCDAGDIKRLERSSDDNSRPDTIESVATEDGTSALHVQMPTLTGWDTLNVSFDPPFASGQTVTCFRAKGSENTRQLAVEWQETDGSRWIATVQLTPEWKSYALPPSAFAPWEPPKGRGGPGDTLNPAKAHRFAVGLAFSHTDLRAARRNTGSPIWAQPSRRSTPCQTRPNFPIWMDSAPVISFSQFTAPRNSGRTKISAPSHKQNWMHQRT